MRAVAAVGKQFGLVVGVQLQDEFPAQVALLFFLCRWDGRFVFRCRKRCGHCGHFSFAVKRG